MAADRAVRRRSAGHRCGSTQLESPTADPLMYPVRPLGGGVQQPGAGTLCRLYTAEIAAVSNSSSEGTTAPDTCITGSWEHRRATHPCRRPRTQLHAAGSEAEARWMVMSIAGISGPLSWPCCCGTICFAKSRRPLRAKAPRGLRGRRPSAGPMPPLLGASPMLSVAAEQQRRHPAVPKTWWTAVTAIYAFTCGHARGAVLVCQTPRQLCSSKQARRRVPTDISTVPGERARPAAACAAGGALQSQLCIHRRTERSPGTPRKPCRAAGVSRARGFHPDVDGGAAAARASLWRTPPSHEKRRSTPE